MPAQQDEWSDSDQEELSDLETSVLLGVPDGSIDVETDLLDAAVSRIGGLPAFLPSPEPPFDSSHCKTCSNPMELLVQMWCPFENSPMDRALYIWGCARIGCQGESASVRAWRGLRFNERYAAKLEQKRIRESANNLVKSAQKKNPFAVGAGDADPHIFNMSAQIFGHVSSAVGSVEDDGDDQSDSASSERSLLTALASVTIAESPWRCAPSYPTLYLSTVGEYLPPQAKLKVPKGIQVGDDETKDKDVSWATETYENSLEMDHVFERFIKRVGYEGEQCVRYNLGGTPLPFASDKTFDVLWPTPPHEPLPVTKAVFKAVPTVRRVYDASSVPRCSACGSRRVFECQLMPNLINVLRPSWADDNEKKLTDRERRAAVKRELAGDNKEAKRGLEWGTCLVYSCEKDCSDDGCWREEVVYVQWDG